MVRSLLVLLRRSLCIDSCAFGFKRTMDHLRAWQVVLPEGVKKAVVSLSSKDESDPLSPHHATRLFVYENIPQLKYHNPSVQVRIEQHKNENSKIIFHSEDGGSEEITTTGLRQRDIQHKVETFSQLNKS